MEFVLTQIIENTFRVEMTPEVFEDFKAQLLDYGTPFTNSLYEFIKNMPCREFCRIMLELASGEAEVRFGPGDCFDFYSAIHSMLTLYTFDHYNEESSEEVDSYGEFIDPSTNNDDEYELPF